MSKAIQGAAMLGGAAVLGGIGFALATTGVGFGALPFLLHGMEALAVGGLSMEAGAIAGMLTSNRGMAITTRQTAAARQIIYGMRRIGGVIIYKSTTGSHHDQFNYVIVLAGHECDSLVNLYLDGRQVHWNVGSHGNITRNGFNFGGDSDGNTYTGPNGQQYNFGGKVYCEARFGDQAEGDVMDSLTANDPNWAASSSGSPWVGGCCYIYLKVEYDSNLFPGEPEVRVTVNGKNNIWDPRTNTRIFTSNCALICADVITDTVFGLGDDSVNQDQLIAAANVCDELVDLAIAPGGLQEARYACSSSYDTSMAPGDAAEQLFRAMGGRLSRIGGEWYIFPAYWQGPSFSFDAGALTGDIRWEPYRSYSELYNRVNGTYTAPTFPFNILGNLYDQNLFYAGETQNNFPFAWQSTNFPQYAADPLHGYAADEYLNEDSGVSAAYDPAVAFSQDTVVSYTQVVGGVNVATVWRSLVDGNVGNTPSSSPTYWVNAAVPLPYELSLPCVISEPQSQRLAKIAMLRNRQQGSGSFPMSLSAWKMQPVDVMQFTFSANGWDHKLLEITGASFSVTEDEKTSAQKLGVVMAVAETAASVYEWDPGEEISVYDVPDTPQQVSFTPAQPTSFRATDLPLVGADGVVSPRVELQWDTPRDLLVTQIQVQYQLYLASTWTNVGLVDVALNSSFVMGLMAGSFYSFRIRSVRANGATSDWVELDDFLVGLVFSTVTAPVPLSPASLTGVAYSDGTAGILVSPFSAAVGAIARDVLASQFTIRPLLQGTKYWVYYIDKAFAGGAITPIATTNELDFLNVGGSLQLGYFLVGSLITPTNTGGGGGGGSGTYLPSASNDSGSITTTGPGGAYAGAGIHATVNGKSDNFGDAEVLSGNFAVYGFPNVVLGYDATLYVTADVPDPGTSPSCEWTITGGGGSILDVTGVTAENTYTVPVPAGTNLSTISVQATVSPTSTTSSNPGPFSYQLNIGNIYIQ